MRKSLFSLIISLLTIVTAWADATIRLQAPNAVAVGQQFRVEYVVNARASECRATIESEGFEVLYGPSTSSSSSTSIVNGQVSSEVRTT